MIALLLCIILAKLLFWTEGKIGDLTNQQCSSRIFLKQTNLKRRILKKKSQIFASQKEKDFFFFTYCPSSSVVNFTCFGCHDSWQFRTKNLICLFQYLTHLILCGHLKWKNIFCFSLFYYSIEHHTAAQMKAIEYYLYIYHIMAFSSATARENFGHVYAIILFRQDGKCSFAMVVHLWVFLIHTALMSLSCYHGDHDKQTLK